MAFGRGLYLKLRPYQFAAVESLFAYWRHHFGNPVVVMPTGTGKSLVIAEFIRRAILKYPKTRILVLTHVKELIEQNFEKLVDIFPTAPAGVFSAGLNRKDYGRQVTFAGIGSVASCPEVFGKVDIILIDECHTVGIKENAQYRKVINALSQINPLLKVAGLTATPYRLGMGMIIEPGGIFTDICYDISALDEFNKLLLQGYLCPLVPQPTDTELDISEVHTVAGDYNQKELAQAVDKDSITKAAVAEMIEKGAARKSWLVFTSGIKHAVHVAQQLNLLGISAVAVHSNTKEFPMTDAARDKAVADFKAGKIRALVNNGVFTTGFDFPGIDLIAVLRPTQSPGLWVQMLGRGTRPLWMPGYDISTLEGRLACIAAGKRNCLVLDFAGNTRRLGPINDPKKPRAKGKGPKGDMPAKLCPQCNTFNYVSARFCPHCGFEFPIRSALESEAQSDELIRGFGNGKEAPTEIIEHWFDVVSVTYSSHKAWNGKARIFGRVPESLRVTYNCGIRSFSEHINLEHDGSAKTSARQWWISTSDGLSVPATVRDALRMQGNLRKPNKIRVWINTPRPRVMYRELPTLTPTTP